MATNTHYDVEDTPPIGSEIDLYQQARQAVVDAPAKAQGLIEQAGSILEEMYTSAEQRGDQHAMIAINAVWERSQGIVQHVIQQHQALTGADIAIDDLKRQRESLAYELEDLIEAIEEVNTDHPKLAGFVETVEEWASDMLWEQSYDTAADNIHSDIYQSLAPLVREIDPLANSYKRTEWLIDMLKGEALPTEEQRQLLIDLLRTMGN
jgi:chromosome segregation ATPase